MTKGMMLGTAVVAVILVALAGIGAVDDLKGRVQTAVTTPCATEDSVDCYWLGGSNGKGHPVLNVGERSYPLPSELVGR